MPATVTTPSPSTSDNTRHPGRGSVASSCGRPNGDRRRTNAPRHVDRTSEAARPARATLHGAVLVATAHGLCGSAGGCGGEVAVGGAGGTAALDDGTAAASLDDDNARR
jgi:hypothetical protein